MKYSDKEQTHIENDKAVIVMLLPFFFWEKKNSVQNECVATTDSVAKCGDWGEPQQAFLHRTARAGNGQKE